MPKNSKRRRRTMLRAGNTACPICLAEFTEKGAHQATLEHVPPRAIQRKTSAICLVCKGCNNGASRYERDVGRHWSGEGDFRIEIPGIQPAGRTLVRRVTGNLETNSVSFDSRKFGEPADLVSREINAKRFILFLKEPPAKSVNNAVALKSGYLSIFALLGKTWDGFKNAGYKYCENPALVQVREQIMCPNIEKVNAVCTLECEGFAENADIFVVRPATGESGEKRSRNIPMFMVRIGELFAILPFPDDQGLYLRLSRWYDKNRWLETEVGRAYRRVRFGEKGSQIPESAVYIHRTELQCEDGSSIPYVKKFGDPITAWLWSRRATTGIWRRIGTAR